MKRVLTILALLLLPLSVWAMTPISDSDLSAVTGQAGVNINADLQMNITIGTMAWGDSDGIGTLTAYTGSSLSPFWANPYEGGYVGIENFNLTNLRIKARENDTFNGYTTAMLKPITIDVVRDPAATDALYEGRTFVRIGLGALEISFDSLSMTVGTANYSGFAGDLTYEMGTMNVGDIALYINPLSYVDIWSHAGQGVNITMLVRLDKIEFGYLSWGDSDGLPGGDTGDGGCVWMSNGAAGYVGLRNLDLGVITINGTVIIDVTTATGGIYQSRHGLAPNIGNPAVTVCRITFGEGTNPGFFRVKVGGPITGQVVLAQDVDLTNVNPFQPGVLGDIYISQFIADIYSGSWVDIWAH